MTWLYARTIFLNLTPHLNNNSHARRPAKSTWNQNSQRAPHQFLRMTGEESSISVKFIWTSLCCQHFSCHILVSNKLTAFLLKSMYISIHTTMKTYWTVSRTCTVVQTLCIICQTQDTLNEFYNLDINDTLYSNYSQFGLLFTGTRNLIISRHWLADDKTEATNNFV